MSQYSHSIVKFADTGLQLRLPVDLVPSTQYSKLTNALPLIEGEIRTRDGMMIISRLYQIAAVSVLSRVDTTVSVASIATTIYPNGYSVGGVVTIIVTGSSPTGTGVAYGGGLYGGGFYGGGVGIINGIYVVTITNLIDLYSFTFTPAIPAVFNATEIGIPVFAQAIDSSLTTTLIDPSVDTLFRLNQALPHIFGDRLAAASGRLYRAPLPLGTVFTELVHPTTSAEPPYVPNGFSGDPISIISFRFTLDTASWAIMGDKGVMYKFRDDTDGNPLFFFLGNPAPVVSAVATADGAGLLDSTGGDLYDWRYTYYDGYVGTEGNPSPEGDAATVGTNRAATFTTPDPLYSSSSHAFSTITISTGSGLAHQLGGFTNHQVSARWQGFTNPVTTPYTINILVAWSATITKQNSAAVQAQLNYSVNGGATFTRFATVIDISSGVITSTATLPLGTDLTQVVIESVGLCNAGPGTSMNSVKIDISDISISTVAVPISGAIAVVNQQAEVLVALPQENDGRLTAFRLYRRGGSLPDAWRLVGTFNFSGLPAGVLTQLTGAGADDGLFDPAAVVWTNPNNVTSIVAFATVPLTAIGGQVMSHWLDATSFGFAIVAGQPIRGITVTITAKGSLSTQAILVRARRGGTAGGPGRGLGRHRPAGNAPLPAGRRENPDSTSQAFPGATCSRISPTRSPRRHGEYPAGHGRGSVPVTNGSHNLNLEVADPAKPAAPTNPRTAKADRPAGRRPSSPARPDPGGSARGPPPAVPACLPAPTRRAGSFVRLTRQSPGRYSDPRGGHMASGQELILRPRTNGLTLVDSSAPSAASGRGLLLRGPSSRDEFDELLKTSTGSLVSAAGQSGLGNRTFDRWDLDQAAGTLVFSRRDGARHLPGADRRHLQHGEEDLALVVGQSLGCRRPRGGCAQSPGVGQEKPD